MRQKTKYIMNKGGAYLLAAALSSVLLSGCGTDPVPVGPESVGSTSSAAVSRELIEGRETIPEPAASGIHTEGTAVSTKEDPTGGTTAAVISTTTTVPVHPPEDVYPPLGKDIMPIGAWVAPPRAGVKDGNPSYINDTQYKLLAESGINLIYGLYETADSNMADVLKSLDLCRKYGLKYLVRDANANEPDTAMLRSALSRYARHPAFAGLKVQDEPGVNSFSRFGELHALYRELQPNDYFYINLLPSYSTSGQLEYGAGTTIKEGNVSFSQYLSSYIEKVKPRFLSYDYYSLVGTEGKVLEGYFRELSTFRRLGLENGIPYWVFIQSCSYNKKTRRPNQAEILWQVNTALSYGAKGIQYFCYFTPIEDDIFQGNFIDKNGNKTEIYGYGQTANRQIAVVDEVLMHCESKGVIVTGTSPAPVPSSDTLDRYHTLTGVKALGGSFLTGCFDYDGRDAFYVTNNSLVENGTATLQFSHSVTGTYIKDGVKSNFSGASVTLPLDAGQGALVYI